MKLLVTSDTHFPFDPIYWPRADVFIHCGDLMYTGYPDEWQAVKESLDKVQASEKLYIPGNHDFHPHNYRGIAYAELRREAKVRMLDGMNPIYKLPNGMNLLALPYVTGLPGWAYNREEEWLADHLDMVTEGFQIDVVATHAPMYGMLDAIYPEKEGYAQQRVGCMAYARWFEKREQKPLMWFNGHIHESYGKEVRDGCHFYNVALCDRKYEQNNEPLLLEI
jgi:hypothetical protein